MLNIRSNAMRGPYMRGIVDRTIKEIHDNLVTVFGPFAADAYLTMNGQPYYTRDGKETLRLMRFDNELSMYILKIMYQAVREQGEKVGDGTTTLAVLYTNLYKRIREYIMLTGDDDSVICNRADWNKAIAKINDHIKSRAVNMAEQDLIQMLFTCTQDEELAAKIFVNLKDAIMANAYITINKSNIESDFVMTTHRAPTFKVTKQFSVFPIKSREERCTILHCNGILDIAHPQVILDLMARVAYTMQGSQRIDVPKTVVILCNGMTEATRQTVKKVVQTLNAQKGSATVEEAFGNYNNVAIYTLDEYRSYDSEQIEDISTIITDEVGIGGLVNQLSFEHLVYQALCNVNEHPIPELNTFDTDMHHIDKMLRIFDDSYAIEFDDILGMRIHKQLGPVAMARYQDLRQQIEDEKSGVKLIELNKRLRTMYGQYIEVEVGSKMMKDSQRKYELILDAVLSASEAVEKGVLNCNSLLVAHDAAYTAYHDAPSDLYRIILESIEDTVYDMISNGWLVNTRNDTEEFHNWYTNGDPEKFNLRVDSFDKILPDKSISETIHLPVHTVSIEDTEVSFEERILEPVSIITTMLENSTLILELAQARTFQLDGFMENYI